MPLIGIILLSYLGIGLLIGLIWVYCDDFSFLDDPAEAKRAAIIFMIFLWGYVFIILPINVMWFMNKGADKIIKKYDNKIDGMAKIPMENI